MLSGNHLQFLLRALRANKCLLFVGAGFSADASNQLGQRIPSGEGLATELWKWLGYKGDYDRTPLSEMYQAAMTSGQSLSDFGKFLEDRLLAKNIPDWYSIPTRIWWYRIYGTNADNVIERAYDQSRNSRGIIPINAVSDDYSDRDQFLNAIQYVKLNGSLPGKPDTLTFSTREYARRSAQFDQWYDHFVRDYSFHPTVFVGSELREPLFWQAIEARQARGRNPEERPASFLVTPNISPAKLPTLKDLNIHHVAATGHEFFRWLAEQYDFPDRIQTLRVVVPEAIDLLSDDTAHRKERADLEELLAAFPRVPQPTPQAHRPRNYFLGVPPRWEDLANGFDAPREATRTVLATIEELQSNAQLGTCGLIGPAGSGKSTVLMRVALTLRQQGRPVFFSEGIDRPDTQAVARALGSLDGRAFLFVDNAQLFGPTLTDLLNELGRLATPPVVIFAARMNLFERQLKVIEQREHSKIVELADLSDEEIRGVIDRLQEYAQLGKLASKSSAERFHEFKVRAKKQILVAMREATEGRGFDEIVRTDFDQIDNREARILFLCAAVATADMIDLDRGQWLACAEVGPADALSILRRSLRGLLIEDEKERVGARHPVIAEFIVDRLSSRADVGEAYVRLLNTIAHDIYAGKGRTSRTWRLFVRLIDHKRIYARFSANVELARSIFLSVDRYFQNDGHFWLQFANLEIEYGEPRNARPYLAYAESLMEGHPFVLTTRAHLALRESRDVETIEDAIVLRREAEEILREQIRGYGKTDEYPCHVYVAGNLRWLERWATDVADVRRELEELMKIAEAGCSAHPYSRRLKEIADEVKRRYLMSVVGPGKGHGSTA